MFDNKRNLFRIFQRSDVVTHIRKDDSERSDDFFITVFHKVVKGFSTLEVFLNIIILSISTFLPQLGIYSKEI